ncbi:MAG: hypothetical protein PHT07_20575 [Paludibacter sp.]|nr:hypothetical protein [Paludibacter sp.]
MKTKIMLFFCVFLSIQFAKAGDPFYYELISNSSKTIDYVFGFYSSDYTISRASDDAEYVAYSAAIINNSTSSLKWNDYYMIVKKRSGDLVFSYETAASTGLYACKFDVSGKETHKMKFCFHDIFKTDEIEDVYLFDKSMLKAFHLVYSKN